MIVWEMDAETRRFTRVSGGAEAVLGYPLERWHRVPGFWIGILHPEDRERVAHAIWRALREHNDCQIEYRAIASDGSVVRLRDRVRVTRDAAGALILQGSIVDLTDRPALKPMRRRRGRRRFRREFGPGVHDFSRHGRVLTGAVDDSVSPAEENVAPPPREASTAGGALPGDQAAGLSEPVGGPEDVETIESLPPADFSAPETTSGTGWRFPFEGTEAAGVAATSGAGEPRPSGAPEPVEPVDLIDLGPASPPTPVDEVRAVRILHALSEAVIASDADHRIVYWSPAAERLLGYTREEAIGREDAELLRTRTTAGQTTAIIEGLLGRRPWTAEVEVQKRDGRVIPVRIGAAALRTDRGQPAGYVAVITDLGDARAAERRRSAASTMDAVARLARGVADELARGVERIETALRSVLVRVPSSDASRSGLDEALRGVDSTAALASELAAAGRHVDSRPGLVDLVDLVSRSMPAVRLLAASGVDIAIEAEPTVRPAAADPGVVSQVLMNLVAHSSAAIGETGRIAIGVSTETLTSREAGLISPRLEAGEWIVLAVSDNRAAMPADLDRLFEPYVEPAESGPHGLGLAAAHGLVVGSGGMLTVTGGDEGLTFKAWFRPAYTRSG